MSQLTIPHRFEPRGYQLPLFSAMDSGYDRAFVVWHRRAGKEKACLNITIKKMLERVGSYYYVFPEFTQGRKILWDGMDRDGMRFIAHFPRELHYSKPNDTEMKVRLKKPGSRDPGSLFQIIGSDRFNAVMGTNPVGMVLSEYALQDPACWGYFRPILAENGGWAIFNTTPRGENHAYQLYKLAADTPAKWFTSLLTVDDTRVVPADVLASERSEIVRLDGNDALYMQEYHCSFTVPIAGAYYAEQISQLYREAPPRVCRVPHEPAYRVDTAWDLGLNDRMAVWFTQSIGRELRVIDYRETVGKGLSHWASEVLPSLGYTYGVHRAPHDIKARELSSGKARIDTARTMGINFTVAPDVPVLDGIECARNMFAKVWIDGERCRDGLNALKNYRKAWNEDRKTYDSKPYHDWSSNAADAWRILAVSLNPEYRSRASKLEGQDAYARASRPDTSGGGVGVLG